MKVGGGAWPFPTGFWKDGLIVILAVRRSLAGGGHLEATPCIPNHLVWISFNWIDKWKEGKIGMGLLAAEPSLPEGLGADFSTLILPTDLGGKEVFPRLCFCNF